MEEKRKHILRSELRRGAYYDSIVLMQLRSALSGLPGVEDSGAVMATEANLAILERNGLLPDGLDARPDDLLVVVKAADAPSADDALGKVSELLARRRAETSEDYQPKSLETAFRSLPDARWVLVSVPGRYARGVARRALELGRNVFLYSDNVPLADEVELKARAADTGLLVLGPDCGTAIVGGTGLGFANRVRRGAIGLVGASGTGLQVITSRIHGLGGGVSHALGTGGRDLGAEVGASTARRALALLAQDADTRVIVLVSKPPSPRVAAELLRAAWTAGKPVVIDFLGQAPPARQVGPLTFVTGLAEAAEVAVGLLGRDDTPAAMAAAVRDGAGPPVLRGLFCGGTLAFEALVGFSPFLDPLRSNLALAGVGELDDSSPGHTIVDLGDDAFTVGRAHPMIDLTILAEHLRREAADPSAGAIVLDVVLGDGAHADPASVLAPLVEEAREKRPGLLVVAVVVGTDEDPQDLHAQRQRLENAGALVVESVADALEPVLRRLLPAPEAQPPADASALTAPLAAVNVGLESFAAALRDQGAEAIHVDWRPPAGGNEKMMALLEKMRR